MNADQYAHALVPYPNLRHPSMHRGRMEEGETSGRKIGKTEARRLMERKTAQQKQNLRQEQKGGLPKQPPGNGEKVVVIVERRKLEERPPLT